jgi:hypothetical protein
MKFKPLETVVLDKDLPEHGLRKGDLGAVEVEFVLADGSAAALLTLHAADLRPIAGTDLETVRTFTKRLA